MSLCVVWYAVGGQLDKLVDVVRQGFTGVLFGGPYGSNVMQLSCFALFEVGSECFFQLLKGIFCVL